MNKVNLVIINMALARTGTTSLHRYMENNKGVSVPTNIKEIKAFLNKTPTFDFYKKKFDFSSAKVLFESSPPYMHLGLDVFENVLSNIETSFGNEVDFNFIFSLRPVLNRAFSHYWHEIGSHYAIFGRRWLVKEKDDPKRFNETFNYSFGDVLNGKSFKNNYLPEYASMIEKTYLKFGQDKVKVIVSSNIESGVSNIFNSKGLDSNNFLKKIRVNQAIFPNYLISGERATLIQVDTSHGPKLVKLPKNSLFISTKHGAELISDGSFDIKKVYNASVAWERKYNTDLVSESIKHFINEQANILDRLPEDIFYGCDKGDVVSNQRFSPETLAIKPSGIPIEHLQEFNLLEDPEKY